MRILVVFIAVSACGQSTTPSEKRLSSGESPTRDITSEQTLEVLRCFAAPCPSSKWRASLSDNYREYSGSKFGQTHMRRAVIDKFRPPDKDPPEKSPGGDVQLIIADETHGLRVLIGDKVWARGGAADIRPGSVLQADLYRFEAGDTGPLIRERAKWMDTLTVLQQAGVAGLDPRPPSEKPWFGARFEEAAHHDEAENAALARVEALIAGYQKRDAAAVAAQVGSAFTDRDIAEIEPRRFSTPSAFEQSLKREFSRLESHNLAALEIWGAGPWVVAHIRRSYRLSSDLEGKPGTAGRSVLAYEMWLLRFEGDRITARWRFRDSLSELHQLGAIDLAQLYQRRLEAK